jgi:pimeloyl-ACP methyl ester carboxylesterase
MTPHGGQDAGVPLIAVNGIELYYQSHGTGAPLLVLAGLGLDVSEMGTLTGPLAARFRVIAADNRGAGRSAKPPGPYSIEQMAADVAGLMDRLELPRAHVLGMSLRGHYRQPRPAMKAQFDATTRFDATARLSQITAPVLIVHGTSDHVAPVAMARQMHDLIPGSRLVLIDGGHLAPLHTRHERLVAEVSAFLTASG